MIYVDSNYWIYWLDSRLPEHDRVVKTMRRAIRDGVAMSYVTLIEVAHYLRMLPGKEFTEVTDAIRSLSTLTLFNLNERIADLAVKMVPEYAPKGLGGRDCVILATMKFSGTRKIVTHDGAFRRVEGIEVIDAMPQRA